MPSLPTRTTDIQTYQDEKIVCAKFQTYEDDTPFRIKRVAFSNGDYQFQMVAKANANATVKIVLGGVEKEILLTPGFQLKKESFSELDVTDSSTCTMLFPAGTFWLYHLQLEAASSPSDWRPAPEDSSDYADDAAQESYVRATSYADMTAEQKAEAAVEAQTQVSIFNKLTNNGQTQGIYLQNGRVYINATYIQTGTLSIKKNNLETFYANADTGVVRIVADEFSLSGGETLASTLADSKTYTDGKNTSMKNYVDGKDSTMRSYVDAQTGETKQYALDAAANAVGAQTQASIFNKLTNNGQTQGIYLSGGKIYLNAEYMATGILADANGNLAWNLATGALSAHRLSIDSTYFKLTEAGAITATSGTFDNVTIKSGCNLAPVSSQVVSNARSDIENIVADTVTANYITSKSAVLGKMSVSAGMVNVDGPLYSSGIVSGLTVNGRNGFFTDGKEGVTRSYTFRDPNGNDVLSFTLTNGILTAGGASNTYTFACTKTFKYSKATISFWAYASSGATSKTQFTRTFVSDISTASGSYTVTM